MCIDNTTTTARQEAAALFSAVWGRRPGQCASGIISHKRQGADTLPLTEQEQGFADDQRESLRRQAEAFNRGELAAPSGIRPASVA